MPRDLSKCDLIEGKDAQKGWKKLIEAGLFNLVPTFTEVCSERRRMYWSNSFFFIDGRGVIVEITRKQGTWWVCADNVYFIAPEQEEVDVFWKKEQKRLGQMRREGPAWLIG